MTQHARFKFKNKEALLKKVDELGLDIPFSDDIEILFDKITIAGKILQNRFVVHPMEGFDAEPNGAPGELTFRRYKRYATGGSGLVWFEATAVVPEGRSNPRQLFLSKDNVAVFKRLVDETRKTAYENFGNKHKLIMILQLTHSGRFSKPAGKPKPIIAHHSELLDPIYNLPHDYPLISDDELNDLQEIFVKAAQLAVEAGFDGVDIKACHGYLVAELLASHTRKNSKYGGSFENRIRFIVETATKIRKQHPTIFVTSRLNAYDAIPNGFGVDKQNYRKEDLSEAKTLIGMLVNIGYPIINITVGIPYLNPHLGRPYDFPVSGVKVSHEHPLTGVARLFRITGKLQQSFPNLPMVGTGYSWLRHFFPHVAAAVVKASKATLIGQGRGALAYPDSVRDLAEKGVMDPHKVCVTCSSCSQLMRDGGNTGCVIRDSEIYASKYQNARQYAADVLKKEAERCRDCDSPMCQTACPAGLDVPGFIKAYGEGDIQKAYNILVEKNLFPEMCALICPVEVQCEGACLENIINARPVAISGIQRAIAREARALNIMALKIPKKPSGKKIAVIGAGPAGIACAAMLIQLGHSVAIMEKESFIGGVPGQIIPAYRIDSTTIFSEVNYLFEQAEKKGRIHIHLNFSLNSNDNLESIKTRFDAVFLGIGLSNSVSLRGTSSRPQGVEDALSFLRRMKMTTNFSVGNRVAVLGGGNTAMDAAIVAKKIGAQDVYIVYRRSFNEMSAWHKARNEALEKGVHFLILNQPIDFIEENGKLVGLKVVRTVLGALDKSGRRSPEIIPNSEFVLPVDHVIEAIGQKFDEETKTAIAGIAINRNGWIKVNSQFQTSLKKIFAGGDAINGGTTAVQAVTDGMKAALAINELIMSEQK